MTSNTMLNILGGSRHLCVFLTLKEMFPASYDLIHFSSVFLNCCSNHDLHLKISLSPYHLSRSPPSFQRLLMFKLQRYSILTELQSVLWDRLWWSYKSKQVNALRYFESFVYAHTEAGSLLYFARTFYLFCFSSILLFNSLLTPPIEVFSDFCLFDNVYLIICLLQRAKWVLTCHLDILNLHKLILNCLLSCIFLAAPVTVFQICVCMCMLSRV